MINKTLFALFGLIACFSLNSLAQNMHVATYNVRLKTDSDVGNLWDDRKEALCNLISFHEFDIFGTQEGFKEQLRSEEHTSELQSRFDLVCRLLLEKKKIYKKY